MRAVVGDFKSGRDRDGGLNGTTQYHNGTHITAAQNETVGWTSCHCGAPFTPGTVLDPFVGSGTTCCVAELHGRNSIGIDLDPRNRDLLDRRMAEVSRNLFDSPMPDTNQLDLFGGVA